MLQHDHGGVAAARRRRSTAPRISSGTCSTPLQHRRRAAGPAARSRSSATTTRATSRQDRRHRGEDAGALEQHRGRGEQQPDGDPGDDDQGRQAAEDGQQDAARHRRRPRSGCRAGPRRRPRRRCTGSTRKVTPSRAQIRPRARFHTSPMLGRLPSTASPTAITAGRSGPSSPRTAARCRPATPTSWPTSAAVVSELLSRELKPPNVAVQVAELDQYDDDGEAPG